jgi:hypothetical protein
MLSYNEKQEFDSFEERFKAWERKKEYSNEELQEWKYWAEKWSARNWTSPVSE